MYCPNCGKILPDDAKFCSACGTPLNSLPSPPLQQKDKTDTSGRSTPPNGNGRRIKENNIDRKMRADEQTRPRENTHYYAQKRSTTQEQRSSQQKVKERLNRIPPWLRVAGGELLFFLIYALISWGGVNLFGSISHEAGQGFSTFMMAFLPPIIGIGGVVVTVLWRRKHPNTVKIKRRWSTLVYLVTFLYVGALFTLSISYFWSTVDLAIIMILSVALAALLAFSFNKFYKMYGHETYRTAITAFCAGLTFSLIFMFATIYLTMLIVATVVILAGVFLLITILHAIFADEIEIKNIGGGRFEIWKK